MSERKDKIKNIAIVFLSIMLVLTFFSNTIMNYSLVEVSTQGVYGGAITTKVRGSGTVEAAEAVLVEAALGRKIETVNVRTGAEVEEGDVLFVLGAGDSNELAEAKKNYENAKMAYEIAILQNNITVEERKVIESGSFGSLTDRQLALTTAMDELEKMQKQYDKMGETIAAKKAQAEGLDPNSAEAKAIVAYLMDNGWKYEELGKKLEEAKKNVIDANVYIQQITLGQQYQELCDLKVKVEELQGNGGNREIKAPMAGTVTQVNYYAGQTVKDNPIVMEIKPENEAYTMQFTVSQTQSKRIKPGDPAEILYNWGSDDITARVANVQRDPMNRESYIVTCELFGDVGVGDYYTLSIGQQSAEYDHVVPTSCIREDSNGKFVLIIESKSTPLGNRYYARRVDVEIITSDDANSAITGALDSYVYVITTTSKPVEENQQVRLAE